MRRERPAPDPAWRTIPNLVTAIRFALIPPIVGLVLTGAQPLGAAALAAVFGASDWVDGFLARRLGQVSRIGAILDPLADRLGVGCLAIALAAAGAAPWWTIAAFPLVDAIVAGVGLRRRRHARLEVSRVGKARTAVAMAGLFILMLGLVPSLGAALPFGQACLASGAALHAVAGAGYVRRMLR